jgi:Tfp pilus assembly protein PilF
VLVLNSYALQLVKQHKFDDSQQQLEQALAAISSSKIEDQVQPYIGLTYLNYSTSLLYQ